MQLDIFERLKTGTWDIHQKTEQRVPVFDPEFDRQSYVRLLERFYGYWAPLETKLCAFPQLEATLSTRLKSHLLEGDLRILGSDPASVSFCANLPDIDSFPQTLGCLYVMEGSTLGARFIAARLQSHLCLTAVNGAAFFNPYGDLTGQRWSEFKTFATAQATPEHSDEIVAAARQTFECFFDWLGKSPG